MSALLWESGSHNSAFRRRGRVTGSIAGELAQPALSTAAGGSLRGEPL